MLRVRVRSWKIYYVYKSPNKEILVCVCACFCERKLDLDKDKFYYSLCHFSLLIKNVPSLFSSPTL